MWLWCQLTSGHERAAPIGLPTSNLANQREFIRDALPDLHERLLILGQLLPATAADARHTLPAQLETTLHARGYAIFRPNTRPEAHERRERPKPSRIPRAVTDRVLAHVAVHTGVDIPTLTSSSFPGMQSPPAVIHARLLAAALLQRIRPTSWNAIGEALNDDGVHVADRQRAYQAARQLQPRLGDELDQLQQAIEDPQTPTPSPPTTPHQQRMRDVAETIQARAAELLTATHGPDVTRRTSITVCRDYTDLTCYQLADIHNVNDAQPTHSRATVTRHRHDDPEFDHRYRQLLNRAQDAQREAGFASANLKRGLTGKPQT